MIPLLRFWHTVRHFKAVQVYSRLWFRLRRPKPDLRPAPVLRPRSGIWVPPAPRSPSLVGPARFRLLNREGALVTAADWNSPCHDKLWLYNLHYFDDLNAEGAVSRQQWHLALLGRWLRENPPGTGTGWEPYPTSLRMVNWIKWAMVGNPLPPEALASLAIQARWLRHRLEWHLLGNHLWANAKALVFAGFFLTPTKPIAGVAKGWVYWRASSRSRSCRTAAISNSVPCTTAWSWKTSSIS